MIKTLHGWTNTLRGKYWTKNANIGQKKSFNTNSKNYNAYLKLQTKSTGLSEMILKRKNDYI